jgi:hypothetical protein
MRLSRNARANARAFMAGLTFGLWARVGFLAGNAVLTWLGVG